MEFKFLDLFLSNIPGNVLYIGYVLIALAVVFVAAQIAFAILKFRGPQESEQYAKEKPIYEYRKRDSVMTAAEQNFFNTLGLAVGEEYRIFAQVRLAALVHHTVPNGQNWKGAFSHIAQKSVDFVLADKDTLATVLAIELDDKSHEDEERKERDVEVERILASVGLPLIRIKNQAAYEPEEIVAEIQKTLDA